MNAKRIAGYFFGALLLLVGVSFAWFMATNGTRTGFGDMIVLAAFFGGGIILILAGHRSRKIENKI